MKYKIFLFTILFIFIFCGKNFSEDAVSFARIEWEWDSPYYDDLYYTSLENSSALLSYRKPITFAEFLLEYKALNPESLSELGKHSYDNLKKILYNRKLFFSHNGFAFDWNLRLSLQVQYLHNNELNLQIDKLQRYNSTPELIALPLELYFSKYSYFYAEPVLGKNYSASFLSYPYTNLPLEQKALDYHFPKRAGFSIGNSFFNIHIGRGRLNLGRTLSGSMVMADTADRLDYFNASVFSKWVKFDMTIAELNPLRFFISHQLSIRPIKQISITLHEGILLNSVFDPRFLNPLMIFHNYGAWNEPYINFPNPSSNNNSIGCQLGVDINIVPFKGFRLYGQFGMNSFQTPSELAGGANHIPNSMGGLFGAEYVMAFPSGNLVFTTEFMYADPWLYIGATKDISFYSYRKEMVYATPSYDESQINTWLANPYGPDTIAAFFKTAFILPHKYGVDFTYRFVVKGENEKKFFNESGKSYYPTPGTAWKAKLKTPSGFLMYFNTLKMTGYYNIIKGLDLNTSFSYTITSRGNVNKHLFDLLFSVVYHIR